MFLDDEEKLEPTEASNEEEQVDEQAEQDAEDHLHSACG